MTMVDGSRSSRRSSSAGSPIGDHALANPPNFLGLSDDDAAFDTADVVIMPVPYERTVSWGPGTADGPRAIIHASRYIELYDHELDSEPHQIGIHTLGELELSKAGPAEALGELKDAYAGLLDAGKFPILLGGEHAVSGPPIEAVADRLGDRKLTVLQFDAHTDLRPEYEGTPLSHASVMYRVHQRVKLVPVGIRALTTEEMALARREKIPIVFSHELDARDAWIDRVMASLGDDVYISFDVDYFDPSVMPSTGTPEPGGGTWHPTMRLLERVFREKRVHAVDVVELAPIPGMHGPDFTVAKLVYKMIAFRQLAIGK